MHAYAKVGEQNILQTSYRLPLPITVRRRKFQIFHHFSISKYLRSLFSAVAESQV